MIRVELPPPPPELVVMGAAELAEARAHVRANVSLVRYEPREDARLAALGRRYAELEARFVR